MTHRDVPRPFKPVSNAHSIGLFFVALAAAGCGSPYRFEAYAPRVTPALGEMKDGHARVNVWYATDRRETGASEPALRYGRERTSRLKLGSAAVSIPARHGRGRFEQPILPPRASPEDHVMLLDVSIPLSDSAYWNGVCDAVARAEHDEVLIYVHGYYTTFELACRQAAQVAHDVEFDGPVIAYCWTSQATFWGYLVDTGNVEWTEPLLVDFIERLAARGCAKRVHVLAHSMGSRAVARAVREVVRRREPPTAPELDQVVLAAADMDAEIFARDYAPALAAACRRVTIYVSNADWALLGSEKLHRYRRLGQWWPEEFASESRAKFEVVDATAHDKGAVGHFYFRSSPRVLRDIRDVLRRATPAERGLRATADVYAIPLE